MRNTLLKMLAAMMWALTASTDVVPVQNFDLEKVGMLMLKVWVKAGDLVFTRLVLLVFGVSHRWQASGTRLDMPVMLSGLSITKPQ